MLLGFSQGKGRRPVTKTQNNTDPAPLFGKYTGRFYPVSSGEKVKLEDPKSQVHACLEMEAKTAEIYVAKPDGELIPAAQGQKKCDYLIYCKTVPQTIFVELKGRYIDRAYAQILDTMKYLESEGELKDLVNHNTEKFAFIVSPLSPRIPKGGNSQERQLMQKLRRSSKRSSGELIYYVNVNPSDCYTVRGNRITCSHQCPVVFPFSPDPDFPSLDSL